MTDVYRDTDERYQRDPAFHAAVKTLENIAREHGFTPGELKQIAFKAALNIEMKAVPALRCIVHDLEGGLSCVRCGFRPQLAITGPDTVGPAQDDTPERLKVLVYAAARVHDAIDKMHERHATEHDAKQAEIDRRIHAGENIYDRPFTDSPRCRHCGRQPDRLRAYQSDTGERFCSKHCYEIARGGAYFGEKRPLIHRGESVAGQYEASEDPE